MPMAVGFKIDHWYKPPKEGTRIETVNEVTKFASAAIIMGSPGVQLIAGLMLSSI